jgi:hypothetical protein
MVFIKVSIRHYEILDMGRDDPAPTFVMTKHFKQNQIPVKSEAGGWSRIVMGFEKGPQSTHPEFDGGHAPLPSAI